MAVYAIGDVQGCFDELQLLLKKINYRQSDDILWFAGDLVNRGPKSLEVVRFIKNLGSRAVVVLGNHDLHLLAIAAGCANNKATDTVDDILNAHDRDDILDWLRRQPLMHHDEESGFTMVHAGLPPIWNLATALSCAREVESMLSGVDYQEFFKHMYGNKPDIWSEELTGWGRLRFIINCFSRLRYCDENGKLALNEKGEPGTQSPDYVPWFEVKSRLNKELRIIFGHWSTLRLHGLSVSNVFPIDTGCVWGDQLTAIKLQQNPEYFQVGCKKSCQFN